MGISSTIHFTLITITNTLCTCAMLHIALWLSLLGFPLVDENLLDNGCRGSNVPFERVRGAERNTKRAMWPCKGRATSKGMIGDEVQRMIVPNQGSGRGKTSVDDEHVMRYPADIREERGFGRRSRRKTKEAKERRAKTGSSGLGGDSGSAKTVKCGGSDGACDSRSYDGDGGPRGYGGSCGKGGLARSGRRRRQVDKDVKDSIDHHDRKSHILLPFLAHSGGSAGLVGADAMKIFVLHDTVSQLTIVFSSIKILSRLLMAFLSIRSHSRYPNSSSP